METPLGGIPRLPDRIFKPDILTIPHISEKKTEKEISYAWKNVLSLYSKRMLTRPRDRLIALSGVFEYFHTFW